MARLRAPRFRGTFLSLAAGVAFSVSPILIQVAYSHGAAVSAVLAWRYLAAALLLAALAARKMLRAPLRAGAATSFLVVGGALGSLGTVGGSSGLICLAAAALVGSVFAVTSFLEGVRLVGPSTASLLVPVEVPVTIALAAVVLKQHLTPTQ